MSGDRVFKCRRLVGTVRCTFEGPDAEAADHELEYGHSRCVCCSSFLKDDERQTCLDCIAGVRSDIGSVVDSVALAPRVIEGNGYRGILWDLLAHIADGSIESPVQQQHPELYPDVEWPNDPWPVIAVLFSIEQPWRETFGHGPRMVDATVTSCAAYLTEWVSLAGRTAPMFDDDAATLRTLASRLSHATGTANDPIRGVGCFDCDGTLVRDYRPPLTVVPAQGRAGETPEGLADLWQCSNRRCARIYEPAEYFLAVRAALEAERETA